MISPHFIRSHIREPARHQISAISDPDVHSTVLFLVSLALFRDWAAADAGDEWVRPITHTEPIHLWNLILKQWSDSNILLGPSTSGVRQNSAISIDVNGIGHLKCPIDDDYIRLQYNSQWSIYRNWLKITTNKAICMRLVVSYNVVRDMPILLLADSLPFPLYIGNH